MDALFTQIGGWLLEHGAGGIVALLAILALIIERRDRNAEKKAYDAEIASKDAAHIETLNRWRTDTSATNDKVSALAEKVVIAIEANKRNPG